MTRNDTTSHLRNPHPKSPCVGVERRASVGQTLPAGSPIVGSSLSPVQGDATNIITSVWEAVSYNSNAISSCSPTLTSPRGAAMSPPSGSEHSPAAAPSLHRHSTELEVSLKTTSLPRLLDGSCVFSGSDNLGKLSCGRAR